MATGSAWNIRVGIIVDGSDVPQQLDKLGLKQKLSLNTSNAEKNVDNLNKKMGLTYQAANKLFTLGKQAIGAMVEEVKTVDKALTEFKKVSDLEGKALDDYTDKLSKMGQLVGRSRSEMIASATEFKKSGYSDEDSAQLAQIAELYRNIADEEISSGDAASFIISQMKAFNIEAKDATHIVDAVNAVSNKYAVSSADLANNIGNTSAAMAAGGHTMEQTLAMLTGITEVTRNASKASRSLNSMQSRYIQILDKSSSTGKKLTDWYTEHGIQLYDQNGQLRTMYDVMGDVANIWPKLTKNEKEYFSNIQAGANQFQNLNALLGNYDTVLEATATAQGAAGSAMEENAKYAESIEYKIGNLKATFQDLANAIIDSDLVKKILDLAQSLLELANTDTGRTVVTLGLLSITLSGLFGVLSKGGYFDGVINFFENLLGFNFDKAIGSAGVGGLAGVGILGVAAALGFAYESAKGIEQIQWNNTFEGLVEASQDATEKVLSFQDQLKEVQKKIWEELAQPVPNEAAIKALENERDALQQAIEKYEEYAQKKALQAARQDQVIGYTPKKTGYNKWGLTDTGLVGAGEGTIYDGPLPEAIQAVIDKTYESKEAFYEAYKEAYKTVQNTVAGLEDVNVAMSEYGITVKEETQSAWDYVIAGNKAMGESLRNLAENGASTEEIQQSIDLLETYSEYYNNLKTINPEELKEVEKGFIDNYEDLTKSLATATIGSEKFAEAQKSIADMNKNLHFEHLTASVDSYAAALSPITKGMDVSSIEAFVSALQQMGHIKLSPTELQQLIDTLATIGETDTELIIGAEADTAEGAEAGEAVAEAAQKAAEGANIDVTADPEQTKQLAEALASVNTELDSLAGKQTEFTITVDTQKAFNDVKTLRSQIENTVYNRTFSITCNASQAVASISVVISKMQALYSAASAAAAAVAAAASAGSGSNAGGKATGTQWSAGGATLVNDGSPVNGSAGELVVANGKGQIYNNGEPTIVDLPQGAKVYTAAQTAEMLKKQGLTVEDIVGQQINALEDGNVREPAKVTANTIMDSFSWSTYAERNKLALQTKKGQDAFKEWQKQLKHQLELDLITQEQYYQALEEGNETYLQNVKGATDDYWAYQEEIYKWKKEQLETENDLLEKQIELERALSDVAKAKTKRIMVYKDGRFQYLADIDAIAEANKSLKDIRGYASGTSNAQGGVSLVGENGPELRVLNSGDGIIPANATKNLLDLASMGAEKLGQLFNSNNGTNNIFNIDNLSLPNVSDAQSFVSGLRSLALQYAYKRA